MLENFTIFIPTMGRVDNQITLSDLATHPDLLKMTKLVVRDFEFDDYDFTHGDKVEVIALPSDIEDIGQTRQWIVDNCPTDYLIMLDDDLRFYKRLPESVSLRYTDGEQLYAMFEELLEWMEFDGVPITGISARQGNNRVEGRYSEVTRQMFAHGVDVQKFKELGLRYDNLKLMEDFHLLLSLFTQGHKNRIFYEYCCGQPESNADGGCSTYRTGEAQKEAAESLEFDFPDFVTVVIKKPKTGWKGMEERHDVRVQWKKAYQSSGAEL